MNTIKKIFVLILLSQFLRLSAQNLVPNPSFETYASCPTGSSQFNTVIPWYGTNNSSEYYNSCSTGPFNTPYATTGFQYARTGVGFAGQWFLNGIGINYREYIQVQLTSSLISGNCYLVKFHLNYPNNSVKYACNNFAAHLSISGYTTNGSPASTYTPQIYLVNNPFVKDTLNWTEIGGIYTSVGGEQFITIGNFKNDVNTDTLATNYGTYGGAYYYIDDVSVEQITTPQWQLRDTMIIGGDSVLIGPLYSGLTCNWFNMLGTPIGSGAGLWVKPTATTSYVLQQTFCNTTFSDTITVYVSGVGFNEYNSLQSDIKIHPQPSGDWVNINFNTTKQISINKYKIFNNIGHIIQEGNLEIINNKVLLNLQSLNNGIYNLVLISENNETIIKKLAVVK